MADRTAPERRNHAVTTPSEVVLKGNRRLVKRRQHDLLYPRWAAKAWLAPDSKRNVPPLDSFDFDSSFSAST